MPAVKEVLTTDPREAAIARRTAAEGEYAAARKALEPRVAAARVEMEKCRAALVEAEAAYRIADGQLTAASNREHQVVSQANHELRQMADPQIAEARHLIERRIERIRREGPHDRQPTGEEVQRLRDLATRVEALQLDAGPKVLDRLSALLDEVEAGALMRL